MAKVSPMRLILPCCLALLLSACAGRAPNPVALVQDKDKGMDCVAIRAEITANNAQITELGREDGAKVGQNIAMGVAGAFIPVLWFGMDFQNASGKEGKALSDRNAYLAQVAAQRCSGVAEAPMAGTPAGTSMAAANPFR